MVIENGYASDATAVCPGEGPAYYMALRAGVGRMMEGISEELENMTS
jgi:hypothetical protein